MSYTTNNYQIGGDHYKGPYEHWDFVIDLKLIYFNACATKYICRWRKKNGVDDLKKAKHYLEKLLSCPSQIFIAHLLVILFWITPRKARRHLEVFSEANELTNAEKEIIGLCTITIWHFKTRENFRLATQKIDTLINEEKKAPN